MREPKMGEFKGGKMHEPKDPKMPKMKGIKEPKAPKSQFSMPSSGRKLAGFKV